jgi:hypothetical protein
VLIMREMSRFSRQDGDETFGELKRIAQRGIAIWFYQDADRFRFGTFDTIAPAYLKAEMMNAEVRRQVAKHTHEAMLRKAQAGYVCSGRCFVYDNSCSLCASVIPLGKVRCCREGHTERRINEAETSVVRRIFMLCADGMGYTRIAKL